MVPAAGPPAVSGPRRTPASGTRTARTDEARRSALGSWRGGGGGVRGAAGRRGLRDTGRGVAAAGEEVYGGFAQRRHEARIGRMGGSGPGFHLELDFIGLGSQMVRP